jgi:hypothetical protein
MRTTVKSVCGDEIRNLNMAKVTKTQITIRVMTENSSKSMAEVVPLIAKENSVSEAVAKGAYRWVVANGLAPGNVEKAGRAGRTAKVVSVAKVVAPVTVKAVKRIVAESIVKARVNRFTGKVKADVKAKVELPKSDSDIAKIKAANLKRMQEVTAKMKARGLSPGQYANPENVGVPEGWTADGARAEVDQSYRELDSFAMPKFLTKDQVKSLV